MKRASRPRAVNTASAMRCARRVHPSSHRCSFRLHFAGGRTIRSKPALPSVPNQTTARHRIRSFTAPPLRQNRHKTDVQASLIRCRLCIKSGNHQVAHEASAPPSKAGGNVSRGNGELADATKHGKYKTAVSFRQARCWFADIFPYFFRTAAYRPVGES